MASRAPASVPRQILDLTREDDTAVIVELDCGHSRHVRHRPPLSDHPWVVDDDACRERIGAPIECLACAHRRLPEGAAVYRSTRSFDENTIPTGLLGEHTTKEGVWARLRIEHGELTVEFFAPLGGLVRGQPDDPVVIPPGIVHRVRLAGPVRFLVEFLRVGPRSG